MARLLPFQKAASNVTQHPTSVFIGDPVDELHKERRVPDWPYKGRKLNNGKALRKPASRLKAHFTHEVKTSKDLPYFMEKL